MRDGDGRDRDLAGLMEIRDNLHARIDEARREGWAGEVEGLQVSPAGVRQKLAQLTSITTCPTPP